MRLADSFTTRISFSLSLKMLSRLSWRPFIFDIGRESVRVCDCVYVCKECTSTSGVFVYVRSGSPTIRSSAAPISLPASIRFLAVRQQGDSKRRWLPRLKVCAFAVGSLSLVPMRDTMGISQRRDGVCFPMIITITQHIPFFSISKT
jgi:hypothetical protein